MLSSLTPTTILIPTVYFQETSAIIEARLIETEATEEKISIAREKYRSVATRGSVLYFVVAQLAEIDPMYQYSLKYFSQVIFSYAYTRFKFTYLNRRNNIVTTNNLRRDQK